MNYFPEIIFPALAKMLPGANWEAFLLFYDRMFSLVF